ncbi:OmpA family protein [Chitinophagaceae bacterium 26-R-25]|nr:OmpA family protein [Chitinophagaceae bacterium 26-R-25]
MKTNKGVKKIMWVDGPAYPEFSDLSILVTIAPDQWVWFKVEAWEPGTTEEDKKKDITWIRETEDRRIILNQMPIPATSQYGIKLSKKLCGNYLYFIEASLEGKPYYNDAKGLYVQGYCPPKIVSSKWCIKNDGEDVRKTYTFCYGHVIYLGLETEGMNGENVVIDVYRRVQHGGGAKDDQKICTYTDVLVIDGEINLKIGNTYQWYGKIKKPGSKEEFYVKVKAHGKYIDDGKDIIHARYLQIKNEIVSKAAESSTSQTPLRIGKPDVNAARYEPCKFTGIKITEPKEKPVVIFDQGKRIAGVVHREEKVYRSIIFNFAEDTIDAESQKDLDNILAFLFEHQHTTIELNGYACVIGKKEDNLSLSKRRADAVKKYLTDGKLDGSRIISTGYGEIQVRDNDKNDFIVAANDDHRSLDNIKYKDEENYKNARRVDIRFSAFGYDAAPIVYETIAPSKGTEKHLTIDVTDFETSKCFQSEDKKHQKQIRIISPDAPEKKGGVQIDLPVHSALSAVNAAPMQYIWPKYNLLEGVVGHSVDSAIVYNGSVHSCRYFSNGELETFVVKAYPDIKWSLKFFLNLTNDLSVKWQNLDSSQHKEWQQKSGKIGAERRWKQKDASLGFSLKAKWNNDKQEKELKYEYETKIKKLYDVFASVGALADGITNKTKGCSPTGIPATFAVKPPNISLSGDWFLAHPKGNKTVVGTDVTIALKATPLIGLEITIDLLGTLAFVGGEFVGAGPGVLQLYQEIQRTLKKGVTFGNDDVGFKANVDIYMDLIITQTINLDTDFKFNTGGKAKDSKLKVEGSSKLKLELRVGVKIKGELRVAIATATAYFEASASGNATITFGHTINYDDDNGGLFYRPILGFDGLNAKYLVEVSVGLAMKIVKDKHKVEDSRGGKYTIAEGTYPNVIPPFDVVKELEEVFGISADIPLIKNDK